MFLPSSLTECNKWTSEAPRARKISEAKLLHRQVPYRKIIFFDLDIIATWQFRSEG